MEFINGFQKMHAKTLATMMIRPQCRLCSDAGGGLGETGAAEGADCGNEVPSASFWPWRVVGGAVIRGEGAGLFRSGSCSRRGRRCAASGGAAVSKQPRVGRRLSQRPCRKCAKGAAHRSHRTWQPN
jgi:hypothetical protein